MPNGFYVGIIGGTEQTITPPEQLKESGAVMARKNVIY